MRKSKFQKTLSMLLAVLMIFMSMNFSVFAEEAGTQDGGQTAAVTGEASEPTADPDTPDAVTPTPTPAEEETGTTEDNTAPPSVEAPALRQAAPADVPADNSTYLTPGKPAIETINNTEFLFAKGTPITISAPTSKDKGAIITWEAANGVEAGSIEVSSTANVFGGGHNHEGTYESTSVTMTGGTVNAVFGGGLHKSRVETTNVVIKDKAEIGQINGGAASSFVKDNDTLVWPEAGQENAFVDTVNVTISGGKISNDGLIFGGGEGFSQTGNVNLNITGGTIEKAYITPGGSNGTTTGTATLNISTDIKSSIVQGVNRGTTNEAVINILGGAKVAELYAGGETRDGNVTGIVNKTTVNIEPGSTVADLQPGKSGGTEIAPNSTGLITLNYDEAAVINEGENTLDKLETRFGAAVLGKTAKPIAVTDADGKLLGGYDDLSEALAAAPTNSTITLNKDSDAGAEAVIAQDKALTIDGNNKKLSINGQNSIEVKGNLALKNAVINAKTDNGYAPIVVEADNASLKIENTQITVEGAGKGEGYSDSKHGIQISTAKGASAASPKAVSLELLNSSIKMGGANCRGITFADESPNTVLTLDNTKIYNGEDYGKTWYNYSRGIGLYNSHDVTVNVNNNSEIMGFIYGINSSGNLDENNTAENLKVKVDHSKIQAWGALNIWTSGGTFDILNGSQLIGIHPSTVSDQKYSFSTIVFNDDLYNYGWGTAVQNTLNIQDSIIEAKTDKGSPAQTLVRIDHYNQCEVNLKGSTKFIVDENSSKEVLNLSAMITAKVQEFLDSKVTVEPTVSTEGGIEYFTSAHKAKYLQVKAISDNPEQGTVSIEPVNKLVKEGEIFNIKAIPTSGYELEGWYDSNGDKIEGAAAEQQMLAYPQYASLTAKFKAKTTNKLDLNQSTASLVLDKMVDVQLEASKEPADSQDDIIWSSSDDKVATVDDTGKVTSVAAGTAIITAQSGAVSAECIVTVNPDQVTLTTADGETTSYNSAQEAVNAATVQTDVISIPAGTYYVASALQVNRPVTISGAVDEAGNSATILTRGDVWRPSTATDGGQASLINVDMNTSDVIIKDLTVQGAKDIDGARGHGINVYLSENIQLNNITTKGNQAYGLVVNGSIVTANGLYTSGNGWGGVNVDQGSGVTNDTKFTLTGEYRLGETYQIKSDKYNSSDNIFVEVPEAFVQENTPDNAVYWNDASTMITIKGRSGNYPTIGEALKAANRGNVILIPAGTYNEDLDFSRLAGLTLQKKDGATGECTLNGSITIKKKDITFNGINAGQNTKVAVSKDASLKLVDAAGFDTDKKITVEKLFGTKYDTNMVIGLTEDQLGFTYLGEKIEPDGNALTNALGITNANAATYTVKTPAQFYWLSQQINEGKINTSNVTIKLGNDLDFHNDEWMPVGTESQAYKGSFDGQGHSISNLFINMPGQDYLGLFSTVKGTDNQLGNVELNNVNIIGTCLKINYVRHGGNYAGALAAKMEAGTIKGVTVNNFAYDSGPITGSGEYVGGIVGWGTVNMENCTVNGAKIVTKWGQNLGGIIGFLGDGDYTIQNCHATDINILKADFDAGGLVGAMVSGNVKVYDCSIANSQIEIETPFESPETPALTYRGELVGEKRFDGPLYLYNCTSVNTKAINTSVKNDQSQLVGGDQTKVKTLTVYNENNKTPYATINEAVKKANSGDTITIGAGTYNETVTLDKAVNLVGPNKDVNPNAAGDQPATREEEAVITGGINITRTTKDANGISIKGLKFTKSGIYSVGWGNDPNLDSITIENNVFENIANELNNSEKSVSAIHFNLADSQPVQNCTIKNNRISGVANGDSSGINVFVVSGETEITGNYIENTNHSALQIPGTAKGNVTITGNTFKNWDQDIANGGRAMRFGDFSGVESLTVTGNKMVRDSSLAAGKHKEQMVAFTKVPDASKTLDLSLNYWNGKLPVTTYGTAAEDTVIWAEAGTAKINAVPYYTDEAMTTIRVPATVYGTDGQEKGQYLTIQEAVNAAEAGETVQLTDGVYTETVTLKDQVTLKGADSGNTVIQCTIEPITSPNGNGENAAVLLMQNDITAKVENVAFDITKTGQSPISFNTTGSLTIEGCRFTGREGAEYGTNAIYGGGNKDATVIFKNNTFEVPYRMAITSIGKNSEVTGNTFNIGTDKVGENQRTSVLTVVAQEGTINISNNIFAGANRAIGVDHSSLSADKLTIKNNQFIDVRYGLELSPKDNSECGNYDLSENYYASTASGTEVASVMLIEDADKSGSHFDGTTDYSGEQVNVYPYYTKRAFNETTKKYDLSGLYAPVELKRANSSEYFASVNKAYAKAIVNDTIVINKGQDGSDAVVAEDIRMSEDINLELAGNTTFSGKFEGTTRGNLVLPNGATATFINTEAGAIKYFTSVDVKDYDATVPTTIKAPVSSTSQNSFIANGGLMEFSTDGTTNTWIYGSPSDRFNGGDGTAEKPWQINTLDQLKLLQTPAFETSGKYFKLTNDITVDNWTALASFAGNFDGNGYTITGNNVNFIKELAEGAKVGKLRFEGFSNLVNTNNGTVENCWTVGEKTTAIVNIMGSTGKLTDSFTAGAMAVQINEAQGTVLRVYHCGETGGIGTAMTKADMQKARFANSLNGGEEGIWDYNADIEAPSAYPFVMKDGKTTTIQPVQIAVSSIDETGKILTVDSIGTGPYYLKDTVQLKASILNQDYLFNGWYQNETLVSDYSNYDYTIRDAGPIAITAKYIAKPKVAFSAMNGNILGYGEGSGTVSINDGTASATAVQGAVSSGLSVTLKAKADLGSQFAYWRTLYSEKVLSYDAEYTFNITNMDSKEVYVAVFDKKADDVYEVVFMNQGNIYQKQNVKKGNVLQPVTDPTYIGKTFKGWVDESGNDFNLNTPITKSMTLTAKYEDNKPTYKVTVENGTISPQKDAYNLDEKVTITANTAPENQHFTGWVKKYTADGSESSVISYAETYSFYANENVIYIAKYGDNEPEEKPIAGISQETTQIKVSGIGADAVYGVKFIGNAIIPENYKGVSTGFIYLISEADQTLVLPDNLDQDFVIGSENVVVGSPMGKVPYNGYQFTKGKGGLKAGQTIAARTYLTCLNAEGVEVTFYSDVVQTIVQAQ